MSGGPQGFRTVTIQTILDPKNGPNVKQYFVNDSDGDPTNIYYAQAAAVSGEKCLEQILQYTTVSGLKVVEKIAWQNNTWNPSWDIV